ncbi:uncharacterized membrane protein (DUF485 family) [Streptacidiphilus sp. MAP12-33]|uniref:DUF485 domain-containing protein n=1 Tax=Streptacidiphilus sp. MAP12-33 TaxID=3156266 RepID=UPI003512494F
MSPQELAPDTEHPTAPRSSEESFDWWAASAAAREKQEQRREQEAVSATASGAFAASAGAPAEPPEDVATPSGIAAADIYRAVHESSEFREIRARYRRFVFPATAAFLLWYLLYVVLAVSAPQLMAHPIAGPFNTAWLLGLLQFASTFLLTWLYARHARAHRDRAALGLRWETQDRLR